MPKVGPRLAASLLCATFASALSVAADPLLPQIVASAQDGKVTVSARASGPDGMTVTGKLTITRQDGSNAVSTSQSSTVTLQGSTETVIAETTINMSDSDALVVVLDLTQDGEIRSRTTLETGPSALKTP